MKNRTVYNLKTKNEYKVLGPDIERNLIETYLEYQLNYKKPINDQLINRYRKNLTYGKYSIGLDNFAILK